MKCLFLLLVGALLAAAPQATARDDKGNRKPSREEFEKRREEWKKLTPEQREAKRQEFKERLEKRVAELREKQANNSITESESRDLARSEVILKRFDSGRSVTNQPAAPAPPK